MRRSPSTSQRPGRWITRPIGARRATGSGPPRGNFVPAAWAHSSSWSSPSPSAACSARSGSPRCSARAAARIGTAAASSSAPSPAALAQQRPQVEQQPVADVDRRVHRTVPRQPRAECQRRTEAQMVACRRAAERPADVQRVADPGPAAGQRPAVDVTDRGDGDRERPGRRGDVAADHHGPALARRRPQATQQRRARAGGVTARQDQRHQQPVGGGAHRGEVGEVAVDGLATDQLRRRVAAEVHALDHRIAAQHGAATTRHDDRRVVADADQHVAVRAEEASEVPGERAFIDHGILRGPAAAP